MPPSIETLEGEQINIRETDAKCEVHDWPADGMGTRLVQAMRDAHGKGGINVCAACVGRARGDAKEEQDERRKANNG